MVVGRGHRREHPQPTFCTTKKKVRNKKKPKKYGKIEREKKYGEKSRDFGTGSLPVMLNGPIPLKYGFGYFSTKSCSVLYGYVNVDFLLMVVTV
jgi:hypothetical protein